MLDTIRSYFQTRIWNEISNPETHEHGMRLATAALLMEMSRADDASREVERDRIVQMMQREFQLSPQETHELAELAEVKARDAISLHPFTSLINAHFSEQEKIRLIEMLWHIAFADEELHALEESLVRKVAELIHVYHRDFIRAKHRVQESLGLS